MKLIEIAPTHWINIGTGTVSQVRLMEDYTGVPTATVVLSTGVELRVPNTTLDQLVSFLRAKEQNYEKE